MEKPIEWFIDRSSDIVAGAVRSLPASEIDKSKLSRGLTTGAPFCAAAHVGMYFNHDGSVSACCYNREQIFGIYPDQNINDIWGSIVRRSLCTLLQNNDLNYGCQQCYNQYTAGNVTGMLAARYDYIWNNHLTEAERNINPALLLPKTAEFEMGNICNLECTMCTGFSSSLIRKNRDQLPPLVSPYNSAFVEQLRPYITGLTDAKFLGGEPFLNKLNYKIWNLFAEYHSNAMVTITTNGTVLNGKVKDVLSSLKHPFVTISVDSLNPENYESIRLHAQFKSLMKNMEWFMENNYLFSLAVCPMTTNWQDMPDMVVFCNKNNLSIHFNTVFEPHELSLKSLSIGGLSKIIRYLTEESGRLHNEPQHEKSAENLSKYRGLIKQCEGWYNEKQNEKNNRG